MASKIDFSQRIKEVLNKNNVQIRSFSLLDKNVSDLYFSHRQKAMLAIHNKVFESEINLVDSETIDVFDTQLFSHLKKGNLVLVVLRAEGKLRYVIQTAVLGLFVDRFRLQALDPRKNKRYTFPSRTEVTVRSIDDAILTKIQVGELLSIRNYRGIDAGELAETIASESDENHKNKNRLNNVISNHNEVESSADGIKNELTDITSGSVHKAEVSIVDTLCSSQDYQVAADHHHLMQQIPFQGLVADISLGGMFVTLEKGNTDVYKDQVVAVECYLKPACLETANQQVLNTIVFAVVRNLKESTSSYQLNLQFLTNLPKNAEKYFPETFK